METKVLLSIKPHFADLIFAGSKRYEFRRVPFRSRSVTTVVVYASSPVRRVIGEFRVETVLALRKRCLWQKTKRYAGIEKRYFDIYFEGCHTAYAIKISLPERYPAPMKLEHAFNFNRPPQSFRYLI
jgi:predicted transcriptional regulator